MSKQKRKNIRSGPSAGVMVAIVGVATLVLILGVLGLYFYMTYAQYRNVGGDGFRLTSLFGGGEEKAAETTEAPTEPMVPVAAADGNPASVLCRDSYTVSPDAGADEAGQVVAVSGGAKLTNGQLQFLYLSQVNAYRAEGRMPAPDYSKPLDCQRCPLGDGTQSWQHYFLQQAMEGWHIRQAILNASRQPQPVTEEAFQPNAYQDLHGPNVAPELPVNKFLYQDLPCYTPNETHQAWLDGLEHQMTIAVSGLGYGSLEEYAAAVFGSGVTPEDLLAASREDNLAYMYFTERSFYEDASEEEVKEYLAKHRGEMADDGDTTANIRHILLIPEGAKVASDGKVTAEETAWKRAEETAEQTIQSWLGEYPTNMIPTGKDVNFSRYAFRLSQDPGSAENGGQYIHIRKGQLISELDRWVFNPVRKPYDYSVIRTDLGVHIIFLSGYNNPAEDEARNAVILRHQQDEVAAWLKEQSWKPDYSAVALWCDMGGRLSLADVLYPDVAHERFPKAMVYLQQDYATTSYGSSTVGRGGCGITTMAMLSTYMLDELHTPAMLAKNYANYHDESGTMAEMFRFVPAELGFQMIRQTYNVDEAAQALLDGYRVVSLQVGGHFTRAGHYLLLQEYYPETDTFQVRDSNIANYGRLDGHKVDYFTRANLVSGGTNFFIFQHKVIRIPACWRCGDGCSQKEPELLLTGDYLCARCSAALCRRDHYLTIVEG